MVWFLIYILLICGSFSIGLNLTPKQATMREFFATTIVNMENVLANEIRCIPGVSGIKIGKGSVSYFGDARSGLESTLWLRSSLKLMEKISTSKDITSQRALHSWITSIDWDKIISPESTIKCDTIYGQHYSPELSHSHFTSLTIKNAVVDQLRSKCGARPNVDISDPDLPLSLYLHNNCGILYRTWSGEQSMHKRGYRPPVMHKASLRETTAAALLLCTEWKELCKETGAVMCDPMCGSGTFPVEAALIAADTAPGLLRYSVKQSEAGVMRGFPNPLSWLDLQQEEVAAKWEEALRAARVRDRRTFMRSECAPAMVLANDVHSGSVALAQQAATLAGVDHMVAFSCADVADYRPARPPSLLVTNPPWNRRLLDAENSWRNLAVFLKTISTGLLKDANSGNKNAWVLSEQTEDDRKKNSSRTLHSQASMPSIRKRIGFRAASVDLMFTQHQLA